MRPLSFRFQETVESSRCKNGEPTESLWSASVRDLLSSRRTIQLEEHQLVSFRTLAKSQRHAESSSDMVPRWLAIRDRKPNSEDYHVESWTSFHKKYSTKAYRTSNMTFSEMEQQRRRELEPSIFSRIMQCFHPQPPQRAVSFDHANDISSPSKPPSSPFRLLQKTTTRSG